MDSEKASALFAMLVAQQTDMAAVYLGLAPHPQSGQTKRDLDAAGFFIDQLEMLEAKTRGNLNAEETRMLQQSLTGLRMAFVEAAEKPQAPAQPPAEAPAPPPDTPAAPAADEESRKKFTKKY